MDKTNFSGSARQGKRPADDARREASGPLLVGWRMASLAQRRVLRLGAMGDYSFIRPPYTITGRDRVFIGARTLIGRNALLLVVKEYAGERYEPAMRIGDDTRIGQNFLGSCAGDFRIGSRVVISQNAHVGDTLHRYDDPDVAVLDQPMTRGFVVIEDDAFVGVNAVILPNVRVGRHAVIGAGAVVTRDVPDYCVAAGNPARVIKRYDFDRRVWAPAGDVRAQPAAPRTGDDDYTASRDLRAAA